MKHLSLFRIFIVLLVSNASLLLGPGLAAAATCPAKITIWFLGSSIEQGLWSIEEKEVRRLLDQTGIPRECRQLRFFRYLADPEFVRQFDEKIAMLDPPVRNTEDRTLFLANVRDNVPDGFEDAYLDSLPPALSAYADPTDVQTLLQAYRDDMAAALPVLFISHGIGGVYVNGIQSELSQPEAARFCAVSIAPLASGVFEVAHRTKEGDFVVEYPKAPQWNIPDSGDCESGWDCHHITSYFGGEESRSSIVMLLDEMYNEAASNCVVQLEAVAPTESAEEPDRIKAEEIRESVGSFIEGYYRALVLEPIDRRYSEASRRWREPPANLSERIRNIEWFSEPEIKEIYEVSQGISRVKVEVCGSNRGETSIRYFADFQLVKTPESWQIMDILPYADPAAC